MGGTTFIVEKEGKSAKEAFDYAVEDARAHFGDRMYTGSIKEKESYGFTKIKVPKNKTPKEYMKEKIDDFDKHGPAGCIVLKEPKIDNDPGVKVDNHTKTGTKKWKTIYVITPKFPAMYDNQSVYKECDTKTEAIKQAKRLVKKHEIPLTVTIDKKLTSHNDIEAIIELKESKTELGKYLFFGWAAI